MPAYAQLIYDGADYSADKETRTWTQQYQILWDGSDAPTGAIGLPQAGQAHPSDPIAFLRSVKISRDGDSQRWVATCEFKAEVSADVADPCLKPWEWSRDNWSRQEPLAFAKLILGGEVDTAKKIVCNSAGDVMKTAQVERKFPTYKLSKCFRIGEGIDEDLVQDKMNDAEIKLLGKIYPKWTLLVRDIRTAKVNERVIVYDAAGMMIDDYTGYLKVDMDIAYNPDTWALKLVDAGLYEVVDEKRRRITDDAGREIDADYPLDGNGVKLSKAYIDAREFSILEFCQYDPADFSTLNLPEVP